MYKYERVHICLNEDKIKAKYNPKIEKKCAACGNSTCEDKNIESNLTCIKEKWDIKRKDWEQGFDSDCFAHCCQYDICFEIFKDIECHKEGHMQPIIVELEEKVLGSEEPIKSKN